MSYLCHQEKRLFIHIPKCAGTSMEQVHWNLGNGHRTIADYYSENIKYKDYFKWCFVRNPWERLASFYESSPPIFEAFPDFGTFASTVFEERETLQITAINWSSLPTIPRLPVQRIHLFPMTSLLTWKCKVEMDFIGRYEQLHTDWAYLCSKLGKDPALPHVNARSSDSQRRNSNWKDLYTPRLVDLVSETYRSDVEAFGYEF